MADRKPLSKRTRFEVMKRDGHRCRYCGATAVEVRLVVDHVVAVANGGTDDATNLVTACEPCNAGKSAVPLETKRFRNEASAEAAQDHAEQIRAYLEAQREVVAARNEILDEVNSYWVDAFGCDAPPQFLSVASGAIASTTLIEFFDAIMAAASHRDFGSGRYNGANNQLSRRRYALAVLRNNRASVPRSEAD